MNTPRTSALIQLVGQYGVQCSETKELAPNQELSAAFNDVVQLETEVQELRAALEVAVVSHRNLYKATFGEKSDPHNDGVFTQMCAALEKVQK